MNGFLIFLIVLVAILLVGIIAVVVTASIQNSQTSRPTAIRPCSQTIPTTDLINISTNKEVTYCGKGDTGTYYYLGGASPQTDYVVSTFPTEPMTVCRQYCTDGLEDDNCKGPNYSGRTAQELYNLCVEQLILPYSQRCHTPAPLAVQGVTLYYAFQPTSAGC